VVADLPEWLHDSLNGFEAPPRPAPRPAGAVPKPGEIVLANSPGDDSELSRLVAVVDVHPQTYSVVALLISNRVEDRTDADFLAEPDETGLPYPVVIQSDIVGALFENQLSHPHGTVPDGLMGAIRRVQIGGSAGDDDGRRGLPLRSRLDPRWRQKESEIDDMQQLAATCTETLLAPPVIDPGIVEFEMRSAEEIEAACAALLEAHQQGMGVLPGWMAELAQEQLAAVAVSPDVLSALSDALLEVVADSPTSAPPQAAAAEMPARLAGRGGALDRLVGERLQAGIPVTRVATIADLWDEDAVAERIEVRLGETHGVVDAELIPV
jgi:hypothetical protein